MRKLLIALVALSLFVFAGCEGDSNADKVGENLGKEAEKFNVQRNILFVNAITDEVLWQVEGRCSSMARMIIRSISWVCQTTRLG
jgi:hypothetical protein